MDPTEIDLDQFETLEDVEEVIGGKAHPAWLLACQFRGVHDLPEEEWAKVIRDVWTDEDEEWALYLNGSGEPWYPVVATVGEGFPGPGAIEVPAGAHFVTVDFEALGVLHPDRVEYFCDRAVTKPWGSAILHALRDRLCDLGMDLPRVSELATEVDA